MPDRLMLIDGHSLVFRGFYALQETRPLTNAQGELTTGVFAFTSMLLKALEDLKPRGLAAAARSLHSASNENSLFRAEEDPARMTGRSDARADAATAPSETS